MLDFYLIDNYRNNFQKLTKNIFLKHFILKQRLSYFIEDYSNLTGEYKQLDRENKEIGDKLNDFSGKTPYDRLRDHSNKLLDREQVVIKALRRNGLEKRIRAIRSEYGTKDKEF